MTGDTGPVVGGGGLRLAGRRLAPVGPARMYLCGITPYDVIGPYADQYRDPRIYRPRFVEVRLRSAPS